MTSKEIRTTQDKSIRQVPIVLWERFVRSCKSEGKTVTEGIVECLDWFLTRENNSGKG